MDPARIRIDAQVPEPMNRLSFRNTYAGVLGLGERIEAAEGIRNNGERVRVQQDAPGEFQAAEKFSHFTYEVNLAGPSRPAQLSHVSSLNHERGLLMMADLLPQATNESSNFAAALIDLEVPSGWTIASNLRVKGSKFSTDDPEAAVFLIGPAVHEQRQQLGATMISLISDGKWPFSNHDAFKIAGRIIDQYLRVTGFNLRRDVVLMLLPYPGGAGPESWTAETRGNDVVLLLGRGASRKRVLAKLGIVLSHEIFHLWVPNSLKLVGNYDWFFEGFTLYEALRMDLRLRLISFDDYLATIARVYDSYRSSADRARLSLLDASEQRWTTSSALVYDKGLLVAFIYDLSLRSLSDCHESLDDVYRALFRVSGTGQENGNETIIKLLSEHEGLGSFARDYVEGTRPIELDSVLAAYGIQVQRRANTTKLKVSRELNEEQRKRLHCIGYQK